MGERLFPNDGREWHMRVRRQGGLRACGLQEDGAEAHDKHEEYDKDCSMTAKQYKSMMTKNIFPAIVKAFKHTGVKEVRVQQDGARCHTQKKADGTEPMTAKAPSSTPSGPSSSRASSSPRSPCAEPGLEHLRLGFLPCLRKRYASAAVHVSR